MMVPLLGLVSSKKFWTLMLGLGAAIGALEVDERIFWSTVGLTGVLILAQGLTDIGKAKAEIEQRSIQDGFSRLGVMLMLTGLAITFVVASCGWIQRETKAVARNFVDCTKPQLVTSAGELGSILEPAIESLLSDNGHLDKAGWSALVRELKSDAAGCALGAVVSRLSKPRDQNAPYASPLTIDVPELEATWAQTRHEQFGDRTFALGAGS